MSLDLLMAKQTKPKEHQAHCKRLIDDFGFNKILCNSQWKKYKKHRKNIFYVLKIFYRSDFWHEYFVKSALKEDRLISTTI